MATLQAGQWFEYNIDNPFPNKVRVYEGGCYSRKYVFTITKMQALALKRWHGDAGIYWSRKDGNGGWKDVRVVRDIDAWLGDG